MKLKFKILQGVHLKFTKDCLTFPGFPGNLVKIPRILKNIQPKILYFDVQSKCSNKPSDHPTQVSLDSGKPIHFRKLNISAN